MKLERFGRMLARHRRNSMVRRLDRYLVRLHEAIENRNYDGCSNGEYRVLEVIRRHAPVGTVIDVGANVGDWTAAAARTFPNAVVHAFEIVPATSVELECRVGNLANVRINRIGLSDADGEIKVFCSSRDSQLASGIPGVTEAFHHDTPKSVLAPVTTGAAYCSEQAIEQIGILKIDVEGMEDRVLAGFLSRFEAGAIRVVQFEYGYVNAATGFLLKDFYQFFRAFDMVVGKIYPDHVDFREYRFQHEDFLGPNFLAVHSSCQDLIEALAR
jgi:FkbM family methyltransferase